MQTRQTQRKTITLAGRYFTGLGAPIDATIMDLSPRGCRFAVSTPNLNRGSRVEVYLEGSGPHHATIKWIEKGEVGVTFDAALSDELFARFQNSHVPGLDEERAPEAFRPMPKSSSHRFC